MQLARLIYTSTASDRCDQKQVEEILEVSMKLNAVNGITGILYYSSQYFMQYLEGSDEKVEATYARIKITPAKPGVFHVSRSKRLRGRLAAPRLATNIAGSRYFN